MQNESQLMAANGRSIKFTPERFEQIRNLVERGMSREQIAETIGVTVGSLQVTCSRHGISLKRPKLNNGVARAPRSRNDTPAQDRRAQLALRLRYRGIDRIVELPLSEGVLAWLAMEAHFRNLSISDLTAKLIIAGLGSREPVGLTPGGLHSMPMKDAPEHYRLGELASAHPGRGGWGERALVKPLTAGQAVV
jgi:hypothetical protein